WPSGSTCWAWPPRSRCDRPPGAEVIPDPAELDRAVDPGALRHEARAGPVPAHLLPDSATVGDDGWLAIGGCSPADLVREFGTPLCAYGGEHLRARRRDALATFGDGVSDAGKAFLCRAMAKLVHEEGLRGGVATGGELHVALAAGVPAERLVLHGNNKSAA